MTMEYVALIEPVADRFRATASAPLDFSAFGTTEAEALEHLDSEVRERLRHGAKLVPRRISDSEQHPLARFAGDLKGDPLADDWQAAMKAYRQEIEDDPNYL